MAVENKRKLKFPGMSEEKYQVFRERLIRGDVEAKKFRKVAGKIIPRWERQR